jgi:hypothetical protein
MGHGAVRSVVHLADPSLFGTLSRPDNLPRKDPHDITRSRHISYVGPVELVPLSDRGRRSQVV